MVTARRFHVVVGVSRSSFMGGSEVRSKAFRIEANDPVSAGEVGVDRMVRGHMWSYRSVEAKVLDLDRGSEIASLAVDDVKPFGVRRTATAHLWELSAAPSPRSGQL